MMSIFPKASTAVSTSLSQAPSLVRSPAKTAVSPWISLRGLLGDVAVEVVDQDLRALLGQQLGRRAADAAGRAGDDRRLSVQYSHIRSFVVRSGGAYLLDRSSRRRARGPSAESRGAGLLERLLLGGAAGAAPARLVEAGRVRARRRRLGVRAVDVLPEDPVEVALRRAVGEVERQPLREARRSATPPCCARSGRRSGRSRRRLGVVRVRREDVVHRHGERVEQVERLHPDRDLERADEREEVVARVDHRAALRRTG